MGLIKRPLKIIQKEKRKRKKRVFINYFNRVLYYVVFINSSDKYLHIIITYLISINITRLWSG